MEERTSQHDIPPAALPAIAEVRASAALRWLALGWHDIRRAPAASLFYGLAVVAMGYAVAFVFANAYQYTAALATGFLLVGPFMATGLYDISRRLQRDGRAPLGPTLTAWKRNASGIGLFAFILTLALIIWMRVSLVVFALFFTGALPTLKDFLGQVLAFDNLTFLLVYFAAGGVFASIVFAISVVSIPMMLDRDADTLDAIFTSVRALLANIPAMAVWGGIIAALTVLGLATLFIGLALTMPLVGHATWHAYQELVRHPAEAT